ncbi:DNA/RNA polymerase [Periconia macrospinosa]|uniref:DNA-directed RNA polymerase n=1 Tax=Periconia macrospinosa TaxID=97972 RepID=A0A2V1DZV3_9PLEO|nr:DNA/RNA polymerase [Periconia macrospinosa]
MMLARAAERKLRQDAFRSTYTSASNTSTSTLRPCGRLTSALSLPWLGPAQTQTRRAATAVPSMATNSHDARKQRTAPSHLASRLDSRSLATAADSHFSAPSTDFGNLMSPWGTRHHNPYLSQLDRWDASKTLILRDVNAPPSTPTKYGVGGDPTELYQNLHACLRVGLMDRATAIIERLGKMCHPSSPQVIEAHNIYLQAMLERAEQNPTSESMEEIETWYHKHMVQNAIEPSADTLVTLLRASMTLLNGYSRSAAVTKYLNMAEECGPATVDAINSSAEFSDEEWQQLIESQSRKFENPSSISVANDAPVSTPLGHEKLVEHGILPNPAHQVNPVDQKGFGLASLKKSLALFDQGGVAYPHEMEGTREEKDRAYALARQLRIETDAMNAAVERWKAEDEKLQDMGIHGVLSTKPIQALMWQWYSALLPLVKEEMAKIRQVISNPSQENLRDERHIYGPYFITVSPEKFAAITISRVVQACARGSNKEFETLKVSGLTQAIGDDLEQEHQTDIYSKQKALRKKLRRQERMEMLEKLRRGTDQTISEEKAPLDTASELAIQTAKLARVEFPVPIKTSIGATALEFLLKSARITVTAEDPKTGKKLSNTHAAFHHYFNFSSGKRTGFMSVHKDIVDKLQKEAVHSITVKHLPMVVEPKPWTGIDDGGFYASRASVIRAKQGDEIQRAYAHTAIATGDMDQVLAGLDGLGKVPWQINKDIFEVMVQAWNRGETIGGLVAEHQLGERPAEPSDTSDQARVNWMKSMKEYENLKSSIHSQRCFQNFQLEIARAYLKEEKIFFPHSVDFRGRAYPMPPLLNHIAADMGRSLLRFGNGKELGEVGLQWLKIQLANLYGFDKASLKEREQFATDHLSEIYDSATNPLDGQRWWVKAEDAWQCLACCIELKNALDSPDPTRYVSHLPVHQDGTCNGLQHYAALGGDHAGATQVNLEPADRPQDIYTGVAEIVKEAVAKDAAEGNPKALLIKDKVTRKVVKRTVMTNVYGVTYMGAKLQVLGELKDMFPNFTPTKEISSLGKVAMYIVQKIFYALGQIFNGAQEIQYWLGACGSRITTSLSPEQVQRIKDHHKGILRGYDGKPTAKLNSVTAKKLKKDSETFKTSIIWTTPLKMPVVQPYRKDGTVGIQTKFQNITVTKHSSHTSINKRKQLQAFPPNFIHSLDATHMLLSALKCNEMGLDFAAVHDSFWTHAADIPNLNIVLRDAFVRMHSEDIMGRLRAEFETRYAGHVHCAEIIPTSKLAKAIVAWRMEHLGVPYKSKHVKSATLEELALEAERQDLLNSEDPELRKRGEEMVTPTSIWLAHQDPTAFAPHELPPVLGEQHGSDVPKDHQRLQKEKLDKIQGKFAEAEVETLQETQQHSTDLKPADAAPESIVAAAIEAEADGLDASKIDPQKEASLAGTTEASIQSIKANTMPLEENLAEEEEEEEEEGGGRRRKTRLFRHEHVRVWIPVIFPAVPKKGTWDVSRLHDSKYFFS